MVEPDLAQKKAEFHQLLKETVKEVLTEMIPTTGLADLAQSFPTKEDVQDWITEANEQLAIQNQHDPDPHHLCGDEGCQSCRDHDDLVYRQGLAESNQYYESIPGVTDLRETYAAAQHKITITGGSAH